MDIRVLCLPRARHPHGHTAPGTGSSGFSASLVSLPAIHEPSLDDSNGDSDSKVDAHPPCPIQIGVCPQSRQAPDLGTPASQLTAVGHTQDCAATGTATVIPPHFLDAENAFLNRKEDPHHPSWASCSEPAAHMHNTNATADLSACNGTSATLGQHNACPDRNDTEQTRPVTTPSIPLSHDLRPPSVPLELVYATYDASLTYISDDVVLFWHQPSAFSQWTPSPFTVDFVEYNCVEQFMMASKARLFGDDTALSVILASDDPREQKRLGRQVRYFDHDLWQTDCLLHPQRTLRMALYAQGATGAPAWFVSVMRLVTGGLDNIRMYLDDAIGSDDCPIHHVATLATFFARLRLHQLKLSPDESRIGAARVGFLGHVIAADGVRPNDDRVAALTCMPMPTDIKQLWSLLGGLSYYRKFLPNTARRIRPITALLKKGVAFDFTSTMEDTVRALLAELAAPPILVFPDWDAVIDTSRPFRLHCDASTAGLGATLEQEQPNGSIRPIVYISRATLDNEQNWTPMELEAGWVVWSIRRLRRYLFGVYFLVSTDHQCLQLICKIGETKPCIQRWMEFISAYNFRLSYRRGQENANADFLSRLSLPPIEEDISGASALTDLDDLGVYLIRACGFITRSCPVPDVGLGELAPSPYHTPGAGLGGLVPPPNTPVLGGLPLTKDDFRTHRAPMPSTHMTARPRRPYATSPKAPYTNHAISPRDDAPRSTRRTRSQIAILDGNTPSRPDYRTAAHSGFAASAASAPPPLRTSPPPRSARLGSTTSTECLASTSSTPTPSDLQSDSPPPTAPLHPTAPDPDVQAAAADLSNTLLNYNHSDWEQAQREDPLCDATRRYIQLGCPHHFLTSLGDHIPSHQCPDPADVLDLVAKGRLIQGDHDTILLVRNHIAVASRPDGPPARFRRPSFNDSVRIYVPLLARPWIVHACHADASCHLGAMRTLKILERFYWWVVMKACTKWWVRRCLKYQARKTSRQTVRWPVLPIPLPNSHGVTVSVDYFGPLSTTARGNSYILVFTDRFSRRADMFAVTTAELTAEGTANILVNRFIPLWGYPSILLSDNRPQFCARLATAVYKLLRIHKFTTSAYHPSGNGGVERANHTMVQMLAMVCNEHQNDWDVHLPHVEDTYRNSVSAATGLAPNEVHIGRLPRLPLTVFDRSYGGTHQNLDRDQLAYCDLARERQQRAYELVREQHALTVTRVNGRNSALSDALLRRPKYTAGGWVWVYNTAATIRQGLGKGADNKAPKKNSR